MAIARGDTPAQTNKGSSYTNTAGDILVLCAQWDGAAGDFGTPSYGGVNMTYAGGSNISNHYVGLWYLPSPATGSNTFTYTGSPSASVISALGSYTGYNAVDTSGVSSYQSGTTTQDVTLSLGTDAWTAMVVFDNTGSITGNTNLTKYVTGAYGCGAYLDSNGALSGSSTFKANVSNSNSCGFAWSFVPSGGGGGGGNPWYAYAQQRVKTTLERVWRKPGLIWTPDYAFGKAA